LLPYIEQQNLQQQIDFKKPMTDKANDAVRKAEIKLFLSPQDPVKKVREDAGATNYLFCAGSKPGLKDNNGVFADGDALTLAKISNANGTSNTVIIGDTLKGDGGSKAVDVKRQHIALKQAALKDIKEDAGVQDFKDNKNVAGDRCSSWLDGRFLQGRFTGTLLPNAPEPDVNCEYLGGLSSLRSVDGKTNLAFCDGHVQTITKKVDKKVWQAIVNWKNTDPVTLP